ncbi:hypothetical protein [Sinosporangium album]|nr:hypothetical protein [Sinosporangium album]
MAKSSKLRKSSRALYGTFLIACLAVLATSCGDPELTKESRNTITQQEALERIERLIKSAIAGVTPQPKLDLTQSSLNPQKCLDPSDGGPEDRIIVSRSYYLRGIPKENLTAVAEHVKKTWEAQGHQITDFRIVDNTMPVISGRSRPDDFLIALDWTQGDVLLIGANSTCIWPNGTPEPKKP